jgi:hypothetical protein
MDEWVSSVDACARVGCRRSTVLVGEAVIYPPLYHIHPRGLGVVSKLFMHAPLPLPLFILQAVHARPLASPLPC